MSPKTPPDSNNNVRSDDTNFVQGLNNQHPSNCDVSTILKTIMNWREDHTQYCKQIDAVERHRCSAYCSKPLRKQKRSDTGDGEHPMNVNNCRFGYTKCIFGRTEIFIVEKVDDAGNSKYAIELASERNDGNVDCQLILDCGKVTQYMSKYITKTEACCSKSMAAMIKGETGCARWEEYEACSSKSHGKVDW
eukprot:scaffold12310_cov32-Attheya_sp.AAC.2